MDHEKTFGRCFGIFSLRIGFTLLPPRKWLLQHSSSFQKDLKLAEIAVKYIKAGGECYTCHKEGQSF
uniref:Aminotran_1_2 domain-containing protein n=1 Tax=Bursaphelenchus xylophilus TaxID=6326 RepID=A0A1I7SP52_BURXY